MRFLIDPRFDNEMLSRADNPKDCYVRPGEYLHHIYLGGIKYVVAPALARCLEEARLKGDVPAAQHLILHQAQLDSLAQAAESQNHPGRHIMLGDPPPPEDAGSQSMQKNEFIPTLPTRLDDTGLNRTMVMELILRTVYNLGRPTGSEIARDLRLPYRIIEETLKDMRNKDLLEVAGQRGAGDANYEYILKPPRGQKAVEDCLSKTSYSGAAPVPYEAYVASVMKQSPRGMEVTRRNIRQAFSDLVITDSAFSEIGPAVNSATSIFFFGFPGNGKTSIAERITRLMGDDIYIPYAIEVEGQIVKLFDGVVHTRNEPEGLPPYDLRWVRIKRPVIVVGGELTMAMLDLSYSTIGKFYEAPLQMKSNGGIFMIDDFGRQQMRPMDLLNRWIVPLEKRYDYLTTITGKKIEVPFEVLLIFSTNLDPTQLADEAFLRRIKFKIEVRDPDEPQWRDIWALVCKRRNVELDSRGVDYLLDKWYRPIGRPMRMCQPRDILDQMISIAKYNMERVTFSPDLIDAACATYFVSTEKKDFGAKVRL